MSLYVRTLRKLSSAMPNHALQRTEAGRWGFPRFHVLRGQPLSLSLSSLGHLAVVLLASFLLFFLGMSDPLAPFIHSLWSFAVPVILACALFGGLLGLLFRLGGTWLERFIRSLRQRTPSPLAATPASDSQSPLCPSCRSTMILRQSRRGASAGQSFWGCSAYPGCRATRPATSSPASPVA